MPYVHEFGIIDNIDQYKEDEYKPEVYNCIVIDGDFIDEIYHKGFGEKMRALDTFAHNTKRPYKDLCYYGITLIPPSSHKLFLNILMEENIKYNSHELHKLINVVHNAIKSDKWIIHYGI